MAGLLAGLGLCFGALDFGPEPGDEGDATASGEPLEGVDASGDGPKPARLAAVGSDQVELELFALDAVLLALGDEGDLLAARAPLRGAGAGARR
jgi:hypothetical protein